MSCVRMSLRLSMYRHMRQCFRPTLWACFTFFWSLSPSLPACVCVCVCVYVHILCQRFASEGTDGNQSSCYGSDSGRWRGRVRCHPEELEEGRPRRHRPETPPYHSAVLPVSGVRPSVRWGKAPRCVEKARPAVARYARCPGAVAPRQRW